LNDPNVKNLTAASGKARHILYQMLVEHVNSGKRTKRLTLRPEFRLTDAVESSDLVLPEEVAIVGVEDGSETEEIRT
jgi:hypothetical protein